MPTIVITGSDTDVGKTWVTAAIAAAAEKDGVSIVTQKWVQCGGLEAPDIAYHDQYLDQPPSEEWKTHRSPYRFSEPVSPHLASSVDKVAIEWTPILESLKALEAHFDWVIIEGSGGLMVPLSDKQLLIDGFQQLAAPTLLVVPNRVGCINQALLSLEALKSRNIPTIGFVLNTMDPDQPALAMRDHASTIESWSGVPFLGEVPYQANLKECAWPIWNQLKTR
ncbi:dethiobiotin synthase [bacterium]|jgi:dethiobiotin synthetase|nr:dethiobiotin synthase [bacterium]